MALRLHETINEDPVMVSFITASPTPYTGGDAVMKASSTPYTVGDAAKKEWTPCKQDVRFCMQDVPNRSLKC